MALKLPEICKNPAHVDSFYISKILIFSSESELAKRMKKLLKAQGFINVNQFHELPKFIKIATARKHDLIIFDFRINLNKYNAYDILEKIRNSDTDVSIITLSDTKLDIKKNLELSIKIHINIPFNENNLIKAAKKAIGDKINYEIGMQFFDALFGMQMCTHRDLHQRTFEHVIETTKIYAKFLLYLHKNKHIYLTSWILKNCLMASLVHDIGKLLVMHGVLYKEGKLSNFEYHQIKRHAWYSVTALLGGQDISFFANSDKPIETVSGYKEKNLGSQVQKWLSGINDHPQEIIMDIDEFFMNIEDKPTIHSLNKDLLYIVFRHHDGVDKSYYNDEELDQFGKILSIKVEKSLTEKSFLDIYTNALSICDMYDALLDKKRDYRKSSYSKFFALFLLYTEMKKGKFFKKVTREFIKFIFENQEFDENCLFYQSKDSEIVYNAIKKLSDTFGITRDNEWAFYNFLNSNRELIEKHSTEKENKDFFDLQPRWDKYFKEHRKNMIDNFWNELKTGKLISKEIEELNPEEYRIFLLLFKFYYSYMSKKKQKLLINYFIDAVIKPQLDDNVRKKMSELIKSEKINTRNDIEKAFINNAYDRTDLFETFKDYDEDILINELNDYISKSSL